VKPKPNVIANPKTMSCWQKMIFPAREEYHGMAFFNGR
jgi:hypothetical protein